MEIDNGKSTRPAVLSGVSAGSFPEQRLVIEPRYNLEIGIRDFLWRNIRDNRLPQTSPQVMDVATWGDWEAGTHLYSNFQNGGKKWVIWGKNFEHNSGTF